MSIVNIHNSGSHLEGEYQSCTIEESNPKGRKEKEKKKQKDEV